MRFEFIKFFTFTFFLALYCLFFGCGPGLAPPGDYSAPTAGLFEATTSESTTNFMIHWTKASDDRTDSDHLEYFVCKGSTIEQISSIDGCLLATNLMGWTSGVLSFATTGVQTETYRFNVIVRDQSRNMSLYNNLSYTVPDVTASTAGAFISTTGIGYTGFTLNWTAGSDAVSSANLLSYFVCTGASIAAIDTVDECLSATQVMNWTVNTTTLAVTGKTHSTTYYYNVLVKDESGNKTAYTGVSPFTLKAFISSWRTSNAGSSGATQITLPLENDGTYNFSVDWGDNSQSTITVWNDAAVTHTYAGAGDYTVTITGTLIGFKFYNNGDRRKLLNISQWGPLRLGTANDGYFYGASNLTITATDLLNLTGTTRLALAFADCTSLTTVPSMNDWDTSLVTRLDQMFEGSTLFNQNIGSWNTSRVTNMTNMFQNAASFNQNIGGWNVASVTDMTNMFNGATLSTANYNALLIGWHPQALQSNVPFHAGNSTYSIGGAADTARTNIIGTFTWTITDGGGI